MLVIASMMSVVFISASIYLEEEAEIRDENHILSDGRYNKP